MNSRLVKILSGLAGLLLMFGFVIGLSHSISIGICRFLGRVAIRHYPRHCSADGGL